MKGNFNSIIQSDTPVLVDFFAEWCGPCKTQAPILVELSREMENKVKIIKIDVDKNPEIAQRFQIRGVPTLAIFKNGSSVWRQSGVVDKNSLKNIILNHQ
ncbi:thioredoxin [Carboxylicivirga linearis]|uniref:Thioredoxin n=1 Tax=Carboxylicivirga linearis TaxID=1628157 RepID=A0ABS5JW45_9BACT|nr:thioredoxin [Carboxylicivirga linearis]MBS2099119.1 thioredoxin [Carboxylicivirga linearis]